MGVRKVFKNRISALWKDTRANALMLTAFALPMVIASAGIGIHTIQLSFNKRQLQRAADSAALAGAYSLYQEQGNTAATAAANKALTQNNFFTTVTKTVTPGSYTVGTTTYTSAIYVRVSTVRPTRFFSIFGSSTSTVVAEARAAIVPRGTFCALATKTGSTATGIIVAGSTNMQLGCGVATNAGGPQAIRGNGANAVINASPASAAGQIEDALFSNSVVMESQPVVDDPLINTRNPVTNDTNNGACKTGSSWNVMDVAQGNTANFTPGCYISADIKGTAVLAAGTYYIAGGNFGVGANGTVRGTGVTIVLTAQSNDFNDPNKHATTSINGNAILDLSAPTSGDYSGILFYKDDRSAAQNVTIVGNAGGSLTGALYFPNDNLTLSGSGNFTTNCLFLIASTLEFTGNATVNNSCTPPGAAGDWALTAVRLIA
jgi:Flp pilus assembly protein TadG